MFSKKLTLKEGNISLQRWDKICPVRLIYLYRLIFKKGFCSNTLLLKHMKEMTGETFNFVVIRDVTLMPCIALTQHSGILVLINDT